MRTRGFVIALVGLLVAGALPARAAELPRHCLTKDQRAAAIAAGKAVPLTTAIRVARARVHGELVRARLCESPKGLVYVLTLLARDGKVTRVTVEASSGAFIVGK